jgi:AcrR family transcriptional regulator
MPRTGRRPGRSGTRDKILAAARLHFARDGYDHATIRAVARTARVDPKLVMHFFGSKHDMFVVAMQLPFDPSRFIAELATPGIDGLGDRIVRRFVVVWDSPEGRHLIGLIRSVVGHEGAAAMMREFFTHAILGRLATTLAIDEPARRAGLVATQLFGLALVRYVMKLEPIASADAEELARVIGPNVQRYLAGDLRAPRGHTRVDAGHRGGRRAAVP